MNDFLKIAYDAGASQALEDFEKEAIFLSGIGQGIKSVVSGVRGIGTAANNAGLGVMAKYPVLGDAALRFGGQNPALMGAGGFSAFAAPGVGAVAGVAARKLVPKAPGLARADIGEYVQNAAGFLL